jgi:streptogramin lyase
MLQHARFHVFLLILLVASLSGCYKSWATIPPNPPGTGGGFHLFKAPETDGNLIVAHDGSFWYPAWNPADSAHSAIVEFTTALTANSHAIPRNPEIGDTVPIIPTSVALGSDGNVWFGTYNCIIGSVTPSGRFREFVLNASGACATTVGSATSSTGVWFTQDYGEVDDGVGYITSKGAVTVFRIKNLTYLPLGQIVLGPDGNLWFADGLTIGRVTPQGRVSYFATKPAMQVECIIAGPDGNLWYCGGGQNKQLGTMDTSGHVIREYAPGPLFYLTLGADHNIWGSISPTAGLLQVTTSGEIARFNIPNDTDATPRGVAVGQDSNIWFNTFGSSDATGMGSYRP